MDGKQLKNSILQWAIQGKLVPQNPKDEPAQKLLERIAAARNEYSAVSACHPERSAKGTKSKDPGRKKAAPSSRIYRENGAWYEQIGSAAPKDISDEIPFEIPENWAWCRMSQLAEIQSSKRVFEKDYVSVGIPFFRSKEIGDLSRGESIHTELYITRNHYEALKEKYGVPQKGDILLTSVGSIGNFWICDGREFYYKDGNVTQICNNSFFSSQYLALFLSSPVFFQQIKSTVSGTAYNALTIIKLKSLLLPLPPLAEQKRIVAKLEQVLPLAEEYGAAQEQLDKLNKELPEALKKSILQEAIQGKLVPQSPKDEPASALLAKIQKEKEALVKQGKLKKKDLECVPIEEEEIPFEIPDSWAWCRLDSLGTFIRGNGIKRDETTSKGKPCVRYGEMYTTYKVKFSEVKSFTTPNVFDKCQKFHKNDILMALTGENKWDIALAAVYQGDEEVALGGDMCRFTPFECNSLYLVYLINSPYGIGYKRETSTGDIIVHTSTSKLGNFLVPLPPLAEQKRIVAKLEQLFKVL